jgi:uncharacterized membrane protein
MIAYAIGLVLFFEAHIVFTYPKLRPLLVEKLGVGLFKTVVSLQSLIGLGLIIYGWPDAWIDPVYEPLGYDTARIVAHGVMPFAILLLVGANFPSNLRRFVPHPMSTGMLVWAAFHLAANGDLRSVLLFGAFGLYALYDILISTASTPTKQPLIRDVLLVLISLVAYGGVIWLHGAVGGVPIIG